MVVDVMNNEELGELLNNGRKQFWKEYSVFSKDKDKRQSADGGEDHAYIGEEVDNCLCDMLRHLRKPLARISTVEIDPTCAFLL